MADKKKRINIGKMQFYAFVAALLESYHFGLIADFFFVGDKGEGISGGIGISKILIVIPGFYLGLLFCTSFVHFAFAKHAHRLYMILTFLWLLPALVFAQDQLVIVSGFLIAGIVAGLAFGFVKKIRSR